jgi:hypothetical protein
MNLSFLDVLINKPVVGNVQFFSQCYCSITATIEYYLLSRACRLFRFCIYGIPLGSAL